MRAAVVVLVVFALGDVVRACTVFSVVGGGKVLFGSNEDYSYAAKAEMWFVPAAHGERGRVLFGWDDFAQGGMNDAGLTFDGASCPPSGGPVDRAKPVVKGNIADAHDAALPRRGAAGQGRQRPRDVR